jgi:hypothetical protein
MSATEVSAPMASRGSSLSSEPNALLSPLVSGGTPARRNVRPRLSLVILAAGDPRPIDAALRAMQSRCRALNAQVIVVTDHRGASLPGSFVPLHDLEIVVVPNDASPTARREAGMSRVNGDIVTLRDVASVGDGRWLDAFRRLVLKDVEVEVPRAETIGDGLGQAPAPFADLVGVATGLEQAAASGAAPGHAVSPGTV